VPVILYPQIGGYRGLNGNQVLEPKELPVGAVGVGIGRLRWGAKLQYLVDGLILDPVTNKPAPGHFAAAGDFAQLVAYHPFVGIEPQAEMFGYIITWHHKRIYVILFVSSVKAGEGAVVSALGQGLSAAGNFCIFDHAVNFVDDSEFRNDTLPPCAGSVPQERMTQ